MSLSISETAYTSVEPRILCYLFDMNILFLINEVQKGLLLFLTKYVLDSIQFNLFVIYGHRLKTHTIQYNIIWVTCAMHITNDELLYTHKSQGNAIHINTFYSK